MLGERKIFRLNIYDESEAEHLFIGGKDKLWVEINFKKTIKNYPSKLKCKQIL